MDDAERRPRVSAGILQLTAVGDDNVGRGLAALRTLQEANRVMQLITSGVEKGSISSKDEFEGSRALKINWQKAGLVSPNQGGIDRFDSHSIHSKC